jgi:glycosyltransferase involved in cell wall biosynthesis
MDTLGYPAGEKMKVGIDCRELRANITGIGRILLEFLREARRQRGDIGFTLFGNQWTDFLSLPDVFKDYRKVILQEKLTLWWDQIQLKNAIKKNNIDVFFSPYYKIPLLSKTKTILSIFDVTYLLVEPYRSSWRNKFYIKNFIQLASRKAKRIITSSHSTKNDLLKILHLPEEKIEVIYLGVNPKFQAILEKNKRDYIKKKYSIQKRYLLYVGNFLPHKNVKSLIAAYNLLPENIRREYSLVLGGGRPKGFKQDIEQSRLSDSQSIIYCGDIVDEDLPALYSGAELFVFPSLYEGFGLPPVEAMACGCPVASSHASSLPEILDNAALFFNPYQVEEISKTVKLILENKDLRENLRQKGLERAKLFVSARMAEKIIAAFKTAYES